MSIRWLVRQLVRRLVRRLVMLLSAGRDKPANDLFRVYELVFKYLTAYESSYELEREDNRQILVS